MYLREFPITPSQEAIIGALSIYIEGGREDDVRKMRFGLSVLRHATEEQWAVAMPSVAISQHVTRAGVQEMLAR